MNSDQILFVLGKIRPLMHFEHSGWSRYDLVLNDKNAQNGYFEPEMVVFGHFEGVALGQTIPETLVS